MSSCNSKKRKGYFRSTNATKRRKKILMSGMRGFLCTCNGNMKGCIKEAYNILDEYSAVLYPELREQKQDGERDIEDQLKEEIEKAKGEKLDRKFNAVDTGANNCIFINTNLEKIVELGEIIVKDINESKKAKVRYLIRLLPIEVTCKAYVDDIKKACNGIFDKHFKGETTTFAVVFNKRHNNSVLREEVIESLALLVRDRNKEHKVDLKHPKKSIIVEIIKNICCLSVVNNFFELRKYNLIELALNSNNPESYL